MKVRRRNGGVQLRLDARESMLLTSLLGELDTVLAADSDDDPVTRRLYPSAYPDDADAESDYRSITESGLRDERRERLAACVADLAGGADVDLGSDDASRRWIQVVNDLRLALGTRLGVTEDEIDLNPSDPESQPWLIYYWLTGLQDAVVTALMR